MTDKFFLDPDGDVCLRLQRRPLYDRHMRKEVQADNATSSSNPEQGASSTQPSEAVIVDLVVSSKILATVSPVFKAMFYGKFMEGIVSSAARASSTLDIQELPEDDADVTLIVCGLSHTKMEHVSEQPSVPLLIRIANFAKKYLCIKLLQYPGRTWLRVTLDLEESLPSFLPSAKSLCDSLYVAYILDLPCEFAIIMGKIALNDDGKGKASKHLDPEKFDHDVLGKQS
jgi:hypothetical protein